MVSPVTKRLITLFDKACQDYAFKGSMHPDDWDGIDEAYQSARQSLERHIDKLRNLSKKARHAENYSADAATIRRFDARVDRLIDGDEVEVMDDGASV